MRHFTKPLEDITVIEHENAQFECHVSHEDSLVTWFIKGREVRKLDRKYTVRDSGFVRTLSVNDAVKADIGSVTATLREEETAAKLDVIGLIIFSSGVDRMSTRKNIICYLTDRENSELLH